MLAQFFAVVTAVLILLAFAALTATAILTAMGGILGILAAALAWYRCAAEVLASTFGRPVLPNPPLFRS